MFASPAGKRFIYVFPPSGRKLPELPSTSLRPGLYHLTGQGRGVTQLPKKGGKKTIHNDNRQVSAGMYKGNTENILNKLFHGKSNKSMSSNKSKFVTPICSWKVL